MQSNEKSNKPKWLRRLERESWQAELIISGVAIIGSLQLPALLKQAEYYTLLHYDRDTLFICYIAIVYWRILVTGLIVLFIFHFVIRALWIGLVGLNSVYPGGFRANERFAEHFQEKLREEYGDVDGFIARLDRLGSGIFGVGFGIAGIFLNFGVSGIVLILLHSWLMAMGVRPQTVLLIFGALLIPLFLISLISSAFHSKKLRNTAAAKRYLWPISHVISKFTYPLSRRYIITSNNLVTSYYADSKAFLWWFLLAMVTIIFMGVTSVVGNDNIPFFIDRVYHRMADDSLMIREDFTLDTDYEGLYYRPLIPSQDRIQDSNFPVWIPLPEREYVILDRLCSIPTVDDELERAIRVPRTRQRTLDCARQYLTVVMNGDTLTEYSIMRQTLTNDVGDQFGVRATIIDPPLRQGENLLEVTTAYPQEDTGEPRRTFTPFYYFARE